MLLHFNGQEYPVSDESVAGLLDMVYARFVEELSKLDLPTRVILQPMARGLIGQWKKSAMGDMFTPLQKKEDPTLKLAEMILGFVELMSRDFEAHVEIQEGVANLSYFHPQLEQLAEEVEEPAKIVTQERKIDIAKERYMQTGDIAAYEQEVAEALGHVV